MVYLDTSFLAPLVIAEDTSDAVEAYLLKMAPGDLVTSLWTRVELASLISRKQRMGELSEVQAAGVRAEFTRTLSESFEMLTPSPADYSMAEELLAHHKTGLRAGDALHLAVASNQGGLEVLTLDQGLIKAAKQLGLKAKTGIRLPAK